METSHPNLATDRQFNPVETSPNPVNQDHEPLLRCLQDWLERENDGQKNYRILLALTKETIKKIHSSMESRRFDKKDIASASGLLEGEKELGSWFKWDGIEKFWLARRAGFIEFARSRGEMYCPVLERKSTPGRIATLYWISARPISELMESELGEVARLRPDEIASGKVTHREVLSYQCTEPGEIKCALLLKPWLRNGKIALKGWRIWAVLFPLAAIGMAVIGTAALAVVLVGTRAVNNAVLTLALLLVVIAYFIWRFFIRPMAHLLEDRIIYAGGAESFMAKPGQLELVRSDKDLVIRLVRYSSTCSICEAVVTVEKGEPDFPRRLVGRCSDSPREHVFSFDRVTRTGRPMR